MSEGMIEVFVGTFIGIIFAVAYFGFKQELWNKPKEAKKK